MKQLQVKKIYFYFRIHTNIKTYNFIFGHLQTCLIAAYDRPQVVGDATVGDVAQAIRNSQIETTVALNSFEGSSCKKSDRPQSKTLVSLKILSSYSINCVFLH